ncbi:MAG: site-specific integrase [Actinomycetota bacterium]|nr:site-specific integrase [Actinomycetota bacterium]
MAKPIKKQVRNGVAFTGKSWSYVLRVPDTTTGKTKPLWVGGFDSEKSAKLARDKARVSLSNSNYVNPSKTTLGEYLTRWIDQVHASQIKATTLYRHKAVIDKYLIPELGAIKLQELRPSHVQAFYTSLLTHSTVTGEPLAPRSVVRIGSVLKKAIRYAVDVDGVLAVNPVNRVPLPKGKGTIPQPWSIQELNTFLDVARTHRLFFFYRLSAFTGARRGELLALRWSDFDGSAITISKNRVKVDKAVLEQNSTKGGTNGQRRVPLDSETIKLFNLHRKEQLIERMAIGEYWQDTGYVFVQESGLPLYPDTPSNVFNKLLIKAGLRHTRLHDQRHLHATELLRLGEPLHVVAQRLGHRDAMTTATVYAHVSDQQAETASSVFANAVERGR